MTTMDMWRTYDVVDVLLRPELDDQVGHGNGDEGMNPLGTENLLGIPETNGEREEVLHGRALNLA